MTDISPTEAHAAFQPALLAGDAPHASLANGDPPPSVEHADEEYSVIQCICGYNDDDGNTVFCEICKTWQHIDCYYPQVAVPDVHECVDCKPRTVDARGAAERQRQSRLVSTAGEKKTPKRPPPKSHKKKTKDGQPPPPQINGAVANEHPVERASGSPRDHQPPSKRPKTSHRTSSSTTSINHPLVSSSTRKRAGSTAVPMRSPTKSPSNLVLNGTMEQFSPEFMRLYANGFIESNTNSFSTIHTSDALTSWLKDTDARSRAMKGKKADDVFSRWDGSWDELERLSPRLSHRSREDTSLTAHGKHPVFHWVVVDSDTGANAFLGEITGQIVGIEDYCRDPANRWEVLRHPEPFVFFHDKLPICIDARTEGSMLRYVRRSCRPNARVQIIIFEDQYHFCLVSTEPILAESEVTIGWNMDEKPQAIAKAVVDKTIRPEDAAYMASWISGILANFGGCPCGRPGGVCFFDKERFSNAALHDMGPAPRTSKSRKSRKTNQISPLSTGRATNSRANSEAVNHLDHDEENIDAHSTSASTRSKPSSRDNTPLAHHLEHSVGLGVELSSREQRKIDQQVRLAEKSQGDGAKRRKRNSAGSTAQTPSATASRQLGSDPNASPTSLLNLNAGRLINGQTSNPAFKTNSELPNGVSRHPNRSRPTYAENAAQTDTRRAQEQADSSTTFRRCHGASYSMKMLRLKRKRFASPVEESKGSRTATPQPAAEPNGTTMEVDSPTIDNAVMPPPSAPLTAFSKEALQNVQKSPIKVQPAAPTLPPSSTSNVANNKPDLAPPTPQDEPQPEGRPEVRDEEMVDAPPDESLVTASKDPEVVMPDRPDPFSEPLKPVEEPKPPSPRPPSDNDITTSRPPPPQPIPSSPKPALRVQPPSISTFTPQPPPPHAQAPTSPSTANSSAGLPHAQTSISTTSAPSTDSAAKTVPPSSAPVVTTPSLPSAVSPSLTQSPTAFSTPINNTAPALPSITTTPSLLTGVPNAPIQPPLFSPSLSTAAATAASPAVPTPSPLKKKLSLSDYTRRKRKGDAAKEAVLATSSQVGASSSPLAAVAETLGDQENSTSSPNEAGKGEGRKSDSDPRKAGEDTGPTSSLRGGEGEGDDTTVAVAAAAGGDAGPNSEKHGDGATTTTTTTTSTGVKEDKQTPPSLVATGLGLVGTGV